MISSKRLAIYCIILKLTTIVAAYSSTNRKISIDLPLFLGIINTFYFLMLALTVYRIVIEVNESKEESGLPNRFKFPLYAIVSLILISSFQRFLNVLLIA